MPAVKAAAGGKRPPVKSEFLGDVSIRICFYEGVSHYDRVQPFHCFGKILLVAPEASETQLATWEGCGCATCVGLRGSKALRCILHLQGRNVHPRPGG